MPARFSRNGVPVALLLFPVLALAGAGCGADASDIGTSAEDLGGVSNLHVSTSPSLSNSVALSGQTLTGNEYIALARNGAATRVAFYLDDTSEGGSPLHVDTLPPWDLLGAASGGAANPLVTTSLANGAHTLTARVTSPTATRNVTVQFTIANAIAEDGGTTSPGADGGGSLDDDAGTGTSGGDAATGSNDAGAGTGAGSYWQPGPTVNWQWEISNPLSLTSVAEMGTGVTANNGDTAPGDNPTVYDIDAIINPASTVAGLHALGAHVICYIEVGTVGDYYSAADEGIATTYYAQLQAAGVLGKKLSGYPEYFLNINSPETVSIIESMIQTQCADKGFDGVETDLDETYSGSDGATGFTLTKANEEAYMTTLADFMHAHGLAWVIKNPDDTGDSYASDMEPLAQLDLSEQCNQYDTCGLLSAFASANKPVLNAEYNLATSGPSALTTMPRRIAMAASSRSTWTAPAPPADRHTGAPTSARQPWGASSSLEEPVTSPAFFGPTEPEGWAYQTNGSQPVGHVRSHVKPGQACPSLSDVGPQKTSPVPSAQSIAASATAVPPPGADPIDAES